MNWTDDDDCEEKKESNHNEEEFKGKLARCYRDWTRENGRGHRWNGRGDRKRIRNKHNKSD